MINGNSMVSYVEFVLNGRTRAQMKQINNDLIDKVAVYVDTRKRVLSFSLCCQTRTSWKMKWPNERKFIDFDLIR